MDWSSVKAQHVSQACELLAKSADFGVKRRGLIVAYENQQLPAKAVLHLAYCIANDIPHETKLKFASSETSLQLLRSLGFRAERLQDTHSTAAKKA